jgi:hypothetical protein
MPDLVGVNADTGIGWLLGGIVRAGRRAGPCRVVRSRATWADAFLMRTRPALRETDLPLGVPPQVATLLIHALKVLLRVEIGMVGNNLLSGPVRRPDVIDGVGRAVILRRLTRWTRSTLSSANPNAAEEAQRCPA